MSFLDTVKVDVCHSAISISSGAAIATSVVDTQGYHNAIFVLARGNLNQLFTIGFMQECDTAGGIFTNVSNTVLNNDCVDIDGNDVTLADNTGQYDTIVWDMELLNVKRFIKYTAANVSATNRGGAICFLCKPSNQNTDTEADHVICEADEDKSTRYARL